MTSQTHIDFFATLRQLGNIQNPVIEHHAELTQEVILKILNDLEIKMDSFGESLKITRKAFNIITECLQNIKRYADKLDDEATQPIFFFDRQTDRYVIASGNLVQSTKIEPLQDKLEYLNSLDSYGIQEMYKQVIKRNKNRDHDADNDPNSAGLGFIEMARKSEQKFVYSFYPYNDTYQYFLFVVNIQIHEEN
jgi:Family of unknown function (DUF6272)